MAMPAAAPAPIALPPALAGWWEHVNGSPAWQDGIFWALAALYGVIAASSFIQVVRIQHRVPEYGWTTQKVFQFLNFVVNGARCSIFAFRRQVQLVNPQIFQHVILDLPGLAFFTTYAMLALFWAEISYQARGLDTDGLRSGFYTINAVIYAIQVLVWVLLWLNPNPSMLILSKLFIVGLSFSAALGFLLYGGSAIEVLKRLSHIYGAVLAFQLLMGYGFESDLERLTKALPKNEDGLLVDLGLFNDSARVCTSQLLKLVDDEKKKTASETAPSSSAQTQAL